MCTQPSLYEGFVPADSTKSNVIKFASQLIESSDVKCTDWGGGVNCIPGIVCCCCLVNKSCPTLCDPHGLWPTRLLCPWDFPGKNTGVGCHFLLQGSYQPRDPIHISCTGKECRRCGLDPWVGKSPGVTRESHSLYYSILDKVIEASSAFGI